MKIIKLLAYLFLTVILFILGFVSYRYIKLTNEAKVLAQKGYYVACICGCCEGMDVKDHCIEKGQEEELVKVIRKNLYLNSDRFCQRATGCSIPKRYRICE